jgi:hypothetical protein
VALKGGEGTADLKVEYQRDGRTATVTTELRNVALKTEYAVHKRENGDYIQLAQGQLDGATVSSSVQLGLDARGLPTSFKPGDVQLSVPRFRGEVAGARVTVPDGDGTAQVELGRSKIDGEVKVDRGQIKVKANVEQLDVALRDFQARQQGVAMNLKAARLAGKGSVEFSSQGGLAMKAEGVRYDVLVDKASGSGGGARVAASNTHIQGQGRMTLSASGELAIEGDLHVQTTVSGKGNLTPKPQPAKKVVASKTAGTIGVH